VLVIVVDTATPAVTTALVRVNADPHAADPHAADPHAADPHTTDPHAADPHTTDPCGAERVELLAQRRTVDPRGHGEWLAPGIATVLAEGACHPRDLAAIVAGLGPGPFTGLRVGLVTAASMGQALIIPTYGVGSLDAIGTQTVGTVLVATDARRKEIYWAVYRDGVPQTVPAVNRPDAVGEILRARHLAPVAAVGDGALRYADVLNLPVLDGPRYPPAEALAALAAGRIRRGAPSETLTPLYLRRPDVAERPASVGGPAHTTYPAASW
jgi:tRNA threonylcarbamoyl adenosine modification protein YeaZ